MEPSHDRARICSGGHVLLRPYRGSRPKSYSTLTCA